MYRLARAMRRPMPALFVSLFIAFNLHFDIALQSRVNLFEKKHPDKHSESRDQTDAVPVRPVMGNVVTPRQPERSAQRAMHEKEHLDDEASLLKLFVRQAALRATAAYNTRDGTYDP